MSDELKDPSEYEQETTKSEDTPSDESKENVVHLNPGQDFNDPTPQSGAFEESLDPDRIAQFMEVVFSYCEGLIPLHSFIDKGQGADGRPHNIWIEADEKMSEKMATFAAWAAREGAAVYVIPGTVAEVGQAKASQILQMQAAVVDLDTGDIAAKREHLKLHLGTPTMAGESGGVTPEGQRKLHLWWALTEPAESDELRSLCRLRGEIAVKAGGDRHFRSAHQPIRVAGSVYCKNSCKTQVRIVELNKGREYDFVEFSEAVAEMPPMPGLSPQPELSPPSKPKVDEVLITPVREGAQDDWSRFEGASAAIGYFIRMVHDGRMSKEEGWDGICGYNAAMLRPEWPIERLQRESERLWAHSCRQIRTASGATDRRGSEIG